MEAHNETKQHPVIQGMFKAGAHFGYVRSRRHPTVTPYIFGAKNRVEIIDLEKTQELLEKAKAFISSIAAERGQVLFIASKNEAKAIVKTAAESIGMPYVAGRWIGGSFTNFPEIRRRVEKLEDLTVKREKGELAKYTKKERLLIDREIDKLDRLFSGLIPMKQMPKAIFVIDPRREHIAVAEARKVGIPVIALAGSDCNLKEVDMAIVANDASVASITFFVQEITAAYKQGLLKAPAKVEKPVK